jgi:hypothetical protein
VTASELFCPYPRDVVEHDQVRAGINFKFGVFSQSSSVVARYGATHLGRMFARGRTEM